MLISEIYQSRQGEGLWAGTESIFVRTSGCNLRCWFCDTPYTSWNPVGQRQSVAEVLATVQTFSAEHVVLTGGEPMLWPELTELTARLKERGQTITIETAGTIDRQVTCDLMSISPKLANSTPSGERDAEWSQRHERARWRPDIIRQLLSRHAYQLKFVVEAPADVDEIQAALQQVGTYDRERILLMPQGTEIEALEFKRTWLEPLAHHHGFVYCPRWHIHWYGHRRGT